MRVYSPWHFECDILLFYYLSNKLKIRNMKGKIYTTVALNDTQHLKITSLPLFCEIYCIGFEDGKRNKELDGWYYNKEVTEKKKNNIISK